MLTYVYRFAYLLSQNKIVFRVYEKLKPPFISVHNTNAVTESLIVILPGSADYARHTGIYFLPSLDSSINVFVCCKQKSLPETTVKPVNNSRETLMPCHVQLLQFMLLLFQDATLRLRAVCTITIYVSRTIRCQQAPSNAASYIYLPLSLVEQQMSGQVYDGSPPLHWQQIFHYINQQSLSPPLNYCQPQYLPQHQIGLASKWKIWIIHSTYLPPFLLRPDGQDFI